MKSKSALFISLLLLVGLTGCTLGEGNSSKEASAMGDMTKAPELLEPVDVKMDIAKVQRGDIYQLSTYSGEVVPYTEELFFTVDGSLEGINVMMGDMVQEGDVLAVLSEKQMLEQIESLQKEIDNLVQMGEFSDRQAQLDIAIAKEELEYMHALGIFGYTGQAKELENQKLELAWEEDKELRSLELQKRQDSLAALQKKIGKNKIIAPYSGRVVYVSNKKKGDVIQGYTTMLCLANDNQLSLSTDYVTQSSIEGADRAFALIGDKEVEITYIPYETNELVRAALAGEELRARFSMDTELEGISAGQFAVVMVYHTYKENVLTIPINAIHRDGSGQYVYKQVDGARVRCNVKIAMTTDTRAEVIEGLEEGDMVYVQD